MKNKITEVTTKTLIYTLLLVLDLIFTIWLVLSTCELIIPLLFLIFVYLFIFFKIQKLSRELEQYLDDKYNYSEYDESNDYLS